MTLPTMPYYNQTIISTTNSIRYYFILYDLQFALFNFILFASDNLMPFTFTVALSSFSSFAAFNVHVCVFLSISTSNTSPCIQFATTIAGVVEHFQLFFHLVCATFDICAPPPSSLFLSFGTFCLVQWGVSHIAFIRIT